MFASPKEKTSKSIPELCNNSDLDGDKFVTIWDSELTNSFEVRGKSGNIQNDKLFSRATFQVGDVVSARWGNGIYYEGKIVSMVCNGNKELYDIAFDDGDFKKKVPAAQIKNVSTDFYSIDVVQNHRKVGNETEVKLANGEWQKLKKIKRSLHAEDAAEYARENNLLEESEWKWAQKVSNVEKFGFLYV